MENVLVGAALAAVIFLAVDGIVRKIRHGSSCCGGHEPSDKKVKVTDKNKANYPFSYVLRVDGMYCTNCAQKVENALNSGGSRWAKADIGNKSVNLLSKQEEKENELRSIVAQAGYTLLSVEGK
ncbi:MAG: cation transporter [Lachnospiraceae bacterium]|nr:cation transporter [Lachnospiraceae bacterium]